MERITEGSESWIGSFVNSTFSSKFAIFSRHNISLVKKFSTAFFKAVSTSSKTLNVLSILGGGKYFRSALLNVTEQLL